MRVRTSAVPVAVLLVTGALGLSGCGSDSNAADQVPKSTPDLTVPAGAEVVAGGTTGSGSSTSTSTTGTDTTGTNTTGATTAPAAGGTTTSAAPPQTQAPAQTQAPSGGTGGTGGATGGTTGGGTGGGTGGNGDFDEFCSQNPGACPGN